VRRMALMAGTATASQGPNTVDDLRGLFESRAFITKEELSAARQPFLGWGSHLGLAQTFPNLCSLSGKSPPALHSVSSLVS